MNHPINQLMMTSLDNIKQMVDVDKIVGNPIKLGENKIIVPISKVSFGFGSGGSEFNQETIHHSETNKGLPFGGGAAAGVNINPIAFLVINENDVSLLHVETKTHLAEKMFDLVNDLTTQAFNLPKKENTNNTNNQG